MELLIEIDRYLKNVAITEHHEILKIQQEYVKILKENLKIRDDIFDPNIDENKKVLISLSFLFLLCEKKDVIWESSNRVKVFDYFNKYIPKIYDILKVDPQIPNHEKLTKLPNFKENLNRNFSDINSIISHSSEMTIEKIKEVKRKYLHYLNIYLIDLKINTFWDTGRFIDKHSIESFFNTLIEYFEVNDLQKVDCFKLLERKGLIFNDPLSNVVCVQIILKPIHAIFDRVKLIHSQFIKQGSDIKLTIEGTKDRYPLWKKNSEIGIRLILSNSSKSKTYNTHLKNIKSSDMKIINTKIEIGEVVPGKKEIYIKTTTLGTDSDYTLVEVELCWQNPNGELCETKDLIEVLSQKKDVDWEQISRLQPYTLEQVEKEEDFVGRVNTFDQMYSRLTSTILESSIIWGQKRVGKTSIAKVLEEKIKKNANYSVVYVLIGEQDKRSVEKFLDTLYNSINSKLIKQLKLDYTRIDIPQNDGSLYPIFKYFDIIDEIKPGKRIVILDEFDELPPDLIRYNENSDTFYHNIRAISNRKNIGLIFVGGENIRQIIEASDRLNKFGNYRVDYFNKENNWEDFVDLVQRPAKGNIEFSPEAIEEIYYYTEGNPFYTKMICKDLYVKACKNKNSYIIALDVKKSVADLIDSENNLSDTLTLQHVNHFWKDGIIVDDQAKRDQIETMRRKFLLIFSDAKRNKDQITSSDLTTDNYLSSGIDIQSILESYQSRSIIIDDNGYLRFKPRLVEKWIIEVGMKQISTSFLDEEAVKFLKEKEAGLYVTDKEIILLIEKWENYKGSKIETGHIRFWLDQFKGNKEKRLMFTLLEHIKFYHESDVREKLRAINTKVGTFWHKKEIDEGYQRKRDDVIVSAFGSPAKSGASMCRKFINENNIYSDWAINAPEIKDILANDGKYKDVKTIIFIEDIIGTGRQICEGYRSFIEETHKILSSRDINVFIAAICGTENGKRNIENCIQEYSIEAGVYIIDSLIDSDKCFNENSSVFENDEDRRKSLSIAQEYGKKVDKKQPLGFEDSQLLITFFDTCPNNTLPIFWSLEKGWKPIFPKYG